MSYEQAFLLGLLACLLGFFMWGRWRYDLVALVALLVAVLAGAVPATEAFLGFGHPATVTVALVLIIGRALINSGAVGLITRHLLPPIKSTTGHIGVLSGVAGTLSMVMNNVGALAMLMPAALASADKASRSPALVLMPLSFGSILGGLVTLIGTPPNIIVATFRGREMGTPFTMFDFTPVGIVVAVSGVVFIALVGWRLIPKARRAAMSPREMFHIEDYVTEARVSEDSRAAGETLNRLEEWSGEHDADILAVIRNDRRVDRPGSETTIRADDVILIRAGSEALEDVLAALELKPGDTEESDKSSLFGGDQFALIEAAIPTNCWIEGRSPASLRLRRRFGASLIAVSRQGQPYHGRLKDVRFRTGDILLLQGNAERLQETVSALGCLPLVDRFVQIDTRRFAVPSVLIFAGAIAAATLNLVAIPIALALAAATMVVLGIISLREVYEAVDWPVIVLLGSMIPFGTALESSGTTALLANGLLGLAADISPAVILVFVMVLTMTLSDIINNAATAVVMAPISLAIAAKLNCNPDTFLMAVAIGASCAFLTPIGHQNNTLILGPGGYKFGDYWRMGLPLEILIVGVATPMLLWVWPL